MANTQDALAILTLLTVNYDLTFDITAIMQKLSWPYNRTVIVLNWLVNQKMITKENVSRELFCYYTTDKGKQYLHQLQGETQ